MHKKICAVYGEGAVTDQTCQNGLRSFVLEICWTMLHGWVRPAEVDSDQFETLIENHQHYTTREIADILQISKSSIENHLHQLGCMNRLDVWVPHKLREKNLLDCISACDSLLKRNETFRF